MQKDHDLKDNILSAMAERKEGVFYTSESVSAFYQISRERAARFLEEIYKDSYCARRTQVGSNELRYSGNEDSAPFLKAGGYKKRARVEYWKNFPKDKWYLLDPFKFALGGIVGSLLTLAVQWTTVMSDKKKDTDLLPSGITKTILHPHQDLTSDTQSVNLKSSLLDSSSTASKNLKSQNNN